MAKIIGRCTPPPPPTSAQQNPVSANSFDNLFAFPSEISVQAKKGNEQSFNSPETREQQ